MKPAPQEFIHAGPVARAFSFDNSPCAALIGPFGSGKSVASIIRLKRHMHEQAPDHQGVRSTRFLVARNTFPMLRDAVLPTWRAWFPESVYGVIDSQMRQRIKGKLPDGTTLDSEILFRAFDDELLDTRALLSLELTGAWVNECRELPFGTFATIQSRVGRWPSRAAGCATWSGVIADSNPWSAETPYHDAFVVNPRANYRLFHQPGGLDPAAENLANLIEGYYDAMTVNKAHDPDALAVERDAKFGAMRSGEAVFRQYTDAAHCREFVLPPGCPIRIGIDFGIRACAAVLMWRSPDGVHHVFDELVTFDADLPTFIQALKMRLSTTWRGHPLEWSVGDRAGTQRNLSGETAFRIAGRCGFPIIPSATNELSVRLGAVNRLLGTMVAGKPALALHPRCKWLREGFLHSYKFDRARSSNKVADLPAKNDWSHVHDALQYVAMHSIGAITAMSGGNTVGMLDQDAFNRACANRDAGGFDIFN